LYCSCADPVGSVPPCGGVRDALCAPAGGAARLRRRRGGGDGRPGRRGAGVLELAKALIDVADQLVDPALQLIDRVGGLFERAGHGPHLVLKLVDAQLEIDRGAAVGRRRRHRSAARRAAAIDLTLQLVHVALHAVEPVEERAEIAIVLCLRAGDRERAGREQLGRKQLERHDRGGCEHQ
jgi:hypothetical protein